MNEENEVEVVQEDASAPEKQEYSGTDESAMETAKRRMAERDAEYKAKFAELSEPKRSSKKKAEAIQPSDANYSNEGKSVPFEKKIYSNEGRSVPEKKELPQSDNYSNEGRSVPIEKPASKTNESETSYGKVSKGTGLRGLRGDTAVRNDREAYSTAWKKLK
jgi:hypothetical protein